MGKLPKRKQGYNSFAANASLVYYTVLNIDMNIVYVLKACTMNKSDLKSLDFAVDRLFMKLFKMMIFIWQRSQATRKGTSPSMLAARTKKYYMLRQLILK